MRLTPLTILPFLAALLLAPPAMRAQAPRRPSAAEIAAMRAQLSERQARREELQRNQALIPWRRLAGSPDPASGKGKVLLRLASTMPFFRSAWTLSPGPGNSSPPVRALLCWRGEQWIALPPGAWQATVAIGRPEAVRAFRIPIAPLEARPGEVYELVLTPEVETAVMAMEHEALEASREAVKKLQAVPGMTPAEGEEGTGSRAKPRRSGK